MYMDNFGKFTRRTQPLSKVGYYKTCMHCYYFIRPKHFINKLDMCQKCAIKKYSTEYYFYLSNVHPRAKYLTHIYKNILFKYL